MAVEITEEFVWQNIPPRARDSHKGTFGTCAGGGGQCLLPGRGSAGSRGCTAHRGGHRHPCQRGAGGRRRRHPPAGVLPVPL